MNEIDIDFHGIELCVFYDINPRIGLNILYLYHYDEEISCWLNHYAIGEIKQAIWGQLAKKD